MSLRYKFELSKLNREIAALTSDKEHYKNNLEVVTNTNTRLESEKQTIERFSIFITQNL